MPGGIKAAVLSDHVRKAPPIRGEIQGWTVSASRRNAGFLKSVDPVRLDGFGVALSLTIKDVPASAEDWQRCIDVFFKRLRRAGMIRYHWVIEWQRRGCPHLHAMVFFDQPSSVPDITGAWIEVTRAYRPSPSGQHVVAIHDAHGWFRYLAKHCSRGASHYQRDRRSLPKSWHKTGRLWSKGGDWPISEVPFLMEVAAFHRLRRLVLSHLRSEARTELLSAQRVKNPHQRAVRVSAALRRCSYLRRLPKIPDRNRSTVRAISEWVPESLTSEMLFWLIEDMGGAVLADPELVGDDFRFPAPAPLSA